jgi:hypothetical protein
LAAERYFTLNLGAFAVVGAGGARVGRGGGGGAGAGWTEGSTALVRAAGTTLSPRLRGRMEDTTRHEDQRSAAETISSSPMVVAP